MKGIEDIISECLMIDKKLENISSKVYNNSIEDDHVFNQAIETVRENINFCIVKMNEMENE